MSSMYEEMSFLAYYFHWSHQEIMSLDHRSRRRWCEEVTRINKELNKDIKTETKSIFDI